MDDKRLQHRQGCHCQGQERERPDCLSHEPAPPSGWNHARSFHT
jgi:hypothetical protein